MEELLMKVTRNNFWKEHSDSIRLETIIEEDTNGPTSTELPNEISVSEASSDDEFTPIMIEDIKHCGNYRD